MSAKMADVEKINYPKVILQETGTVDFPVAGTLYTTKTQTITESGFYFVSYSQTGPYSSSVWSIICLNGTTDRIAQVHVATPSFGSPCGESCALMKLSAGDTIYFVRVSAGSQPSNDRQYNITIVKIA